MSGSVLLKFSVNVGVSETPLFEGFTIVDVGIGRVIFLGIIESASASHISLFLFSGHLTLYSFMVASDL